MATNTSSNPNDSLLATVTAAADNTSVKQNHPFWSQTNVDATRWDAVYPYQLLLVQRTKDGKYTLVDTTKWVYTLPFPPESLSESMGIAVSGEITQGGYVEEHAGAPIRNIQLSGSLGVMPLKGHPKTPVIQNLTEGILAGTVSQVTTVAASGANFASNLTGQNLFDFPNVVSDSVFTDPNSDLDHIAKTTGYYQMLKLKEFFENYLNYKTTAEGSKYRLAFAIWKQQAVYLVTPTSFSVNQDSGSPLEYKYSLSFRAWKRIKLDGVDADAANQFVPVNQRPGGLQTALKTILDARDVLENARDIVSVIGGDLDAALYTPLKEITMLLKDASSVPAAFSDLPAVILQEATAAVVQYVGAQSAFGDLISPPFDPQKAVRDKNTMEGWSKIADLASNVQKTNTGSGRPPGAVNGGADIFGYSDALLNGVNDSSFSQDPALNPFIDSENWYGLFSKIRPSQVNLSPKTIGAIQKYRQGIAQLTRADFEKRRDTLFNTMSDFADAVGAGSATYNRTYQRTVVNTTKTPTPSDYRVLFALNKTIIEFNRIVASKIVTQPRVTSMDYVAGLASGSGIAFKVPKSKFAIPYPYGMTLEQVAQLYLGDPDRFMEIVILNGLRSPYIDEIGFDVPLLIGGRGNQIQVGSDNELTLGQQVWLISPTTTKTSRHITKIEKLSTNVFNITLDGDLDLERFQAISGAFLHTYLPGTTNSQKLIYIPSSIEPTAQDYQVKAIPGLDQYDQLLSVGGFDFLLDPKTNDLVITPDLDTRYAIGLANIIQQARIRVAVPKGALYRHPAFGLPIQIGQSLADLDSKQLLNAARNLFSDDPSYISVQSASVLVNGPVAAIKLGLSVKNQINNIPITLNLTKPTSNA